MILQVCMKYVTEIHYCKKLQSPKCNKYKCLQKQQNILL